VEREEFINVGLILYCAKQKFLGVKIQLSSTKLHCLAPELEEAEIKINLSSFEKIAHGGINAGPIGQLDLAGRFRWLTATRSTILQCSKVHSGLSDNPAQCLDRLFSEMV